MNIEDIFHFFIDCGNKTDNNVAFGKNGKRPTSVDSSRNLFCLYALAKITISGNELKTVDLQTKVILSSNMSARLWLFSSLYTK